MRTLKSFGVAVLVAGLLAGGVAVLAEHTGPLVTPTRFEGNFVSFDDQQLCFDIWALTGEDPVTGDLVGYKVDNPQFPSQFTDGTVTFDVSEDGRSLSWTIDGGTMLGVIVKGGTAFNLYDYHGAGVDSDHDNNLRAPANKRGAIPQISHYNICYQPTEELPENNGCTPGYWRNHADRWAGVAPGADFDATFGVDLFSPNITLGQAISLAGGGVNALARHATAALLNAYGGVPNSDGTVVTYPYSVAEVIQLVQDAVADGTIESTKDLLAAANELGCPLSETRAVPVS